MGAEKNRTKRRDKKLAKKKTGMRVDDSARKLAQYKRDIIEEMRNRQPHPASTPHLDPYNGRSRPD